MGLLALALAAVAGLRSEIPWTGRFIGWFGLATLLVAGLFLAQPGLALWAAVLLGLWALWPLGVTQGRPAAVAAVLARRRARWALLWQCGGTLSPGAEEAPGLHRPCRLPLPAAGRGLGFGQSTADWKDELPFPTWAWRRWAWLCLTFLVLVRRDAGAPASRAPQSLRRCALMFSGLLAPSAALAPGRCSLALLAS